MTRGEAIEAIKEWDSLNEKEREALEIFILEQKKNDTERIKENCIHFLELQKSHHASTIEIDECIDWLNDLVPPKWLYRLEYKDETCGLWYNGKGKWCFEEGIGSVEGCKTKDLPMDHDERYKQNGRDWFSSCSQKEDLLHWYSLRDAEELIKKGFVFTRYLATEYHEYENETVFIKETSLVREEIDIFELFGKINQEFSAGDWVVNERNGGTVHQIKSVISNVSNNKNAYDLTDGDYISTSSVGNYHLWTIRDAKDGDILACENGWTCIFKCLNNNLFSSHCFMDNEGWFCEDGGQAHTLDKRICGEIHPATKEQREKLKKAMADAGYDRDAKKLELKKIESKPASFYMRPTLIPKFRIGDIIKHKTGLCPAFKIDRIVDMHYKGVNGESVGIAVQDNWELIEQNPVEWSEEDEKIKKAITEGLEAMKSSFHYISSIKLDDAITWLKFLRPQEQNITNKDFEDIIREIKTRIAQCNGFNRKHREEVFNLLDSLRPQNPWKPSDEQITWLYRATDEAKKDSRMKQVLNELLSDLKKLREG